MHGPPLPSLLTTLLGWLQCLAPTYLGDFALKGADLRARGLNRIGNMLVPNSNYCLFEDWVMPILDALLREQQELGTRWTPSTAREREGGFWDCLEGWYAP